MKPNPIRDKPLYGLVEEEASCLGSLKYLSSVSACKTNQTNFQSRSAKHYFQSDKPYEAIVVEHEYGNLNASIHTQPIR